MFRITARTVLELGSELISSDIIAFYELVKNGFDARTKAGVEIRFDIVLSRRAYLRLQKAIASGARLEELKTRIKSELLPTSSNRAHQSFAACIEKAKSVESLSRRLRRVQKRYNTITVSDSGDGMSLEDLNRNFLVIGTPSRKKDVEAALQRGDKDVPYLGEKGIGRLSAMRLGDRLRVEAARHDDKSLNILEIDWEKFSDVDAMLDQIPVVPESGGPKSNNEWSGTSITISDLIENWTEPRVREMAEYDFARLSDPFSDSGSRPRIAIYWNGERVAIPIMSNALLDAAHASVRGSYEIIGGSPVLTCNFEARSLAGC